MKKLFSVRRIILAGSLLLQLNTLCFHSRGAAGDVAPSFDPGSGVNGWVNAIAVQADGKAIIGGQFNTVKGLARINVAGSMPTVAVTAVSIRRLECWVALFLRSRCSRMTRCWLAATESFALIPTGVETPISMRSLAQFILMRKGTPTSPRTGTGTNLWLSNSWSSVAQAAVTNAGQIYVTVPATIGSTFFRLKSQ